MATDPELPQGEPVDDWRGARAPGRDVIPGDRVSLEPLSSTHAAALAAAMFTEPVDRSLWAYLPYGPFEDAAEVAAWVAEREGSADPQSYAIVPGDGCAAGVLALMRCDTENGSIEIGHVWLGPALQRTPAATEAVYLAGRQAFEVLGHRRFEWKCSSLNARSIGAASRFGFTFEGTFRQHMVVKGRSRDTSWFSILDHEWPAVRDAFEAWLAPGNFGPDGRQLRRLSELRS
jgi:RimJ/RimL family protein N-acetyltransferase